tara:strand:+ start:173 stop:772 length:600 start_codon:yes stop_codon:yes gene_type:complete
MPFGYLGTTPNQQLKNSGVFSVEEALAVKNNGEWGGSLELIAEETFTTSSTVENTSIQENKYDVHLLYINAEGSTALNSGIQFYESGTLETASVYQYAHQYGTSGGSFGEGQSTGDTRIYTVNYGATYNTGLYIYLYNLGNSSKYSFLTYQGNQAFGSSTTMFFGGGVLPQASTVDGFRVYLNTGTITGEYKLYGVKQI